MLDLPAYLRRVEFDAALTPHAANLAALHLAHATHIPFENLDILLGQQISLELDHIQAKLVTARRGGYCFEQNTLFAAVLRKLGYPVTGLAARVHQRQSRLPPRTHMCLLVRLGDEDWLADVGFGGEGLFMPVAMNGEPVQQYMSMFRVTEQTAGTWVLQSRRGEDWTDLYSFSLEAQQAVDFEMANYYVATHPESYFVNKLTVQSIAPDKRQILRDRELIIDRGYSSETITVGNDDHLIDVLRQNFDLHFPAGTRFGQGVAGRTAVDCA